MCVQCEVLKFYANCWNMSDDGLHGDGNEPYRQGPQSRMIKLLLELETFQMQSFSTS